MNHNWTSVVLNSDGGDIPAWWCNRCEMIAMDSDSPSSHSWERMEILINEKVLSETILNKYCDENNVPCILVG